MISTFRFSTAHSNAEGAGENGQSLLKALGEIDWTFDNHKTQTLTHGIHSYPAKFIPQIPQNLISILHPRDDSAVFDPFCGSGTTLVEAAAAGIPAVGVDLNPIACLISKVKVTPLRQSVSEIARTIASRQFNGPIRELSIPRIDHWFQRDVQGALASLMHQINGQADTDLQDALKVALSSIIVRVSNQESDTRYAAIEKDITAADVARLFVAAAESIDAALDSTWGGLFGSLPRVRIVNRDILSIRPEEVMKPVSLVVTSPPYPNAYEYWLYHKYRMYWLGMDPLEVKAREIGARPHYFKREPQTARDFENQMKTVFQLLSQTVRTGGYACFIIGSSIIRGELIDNASILERAASLNSFSLFASITRNIPLTRKAFNPANSRIRDEKLLVFRAEK